jgi:hypothetical protein
MVMIKTWHVVAGGIVSSLIGGSVLTQKHITMEDKILECPSDPKKVLLPVIRDVKHTIYGFIVLETQRQIHGYVNSEGLFQVKTSLVGKLQRNGDIHDTQVGNLALVRENDCRYYQLKEYDFPLKRPSDYINEK